MSGPRTFKITDNSSITAPPFAVKEWTDTTMLVFNFKSWLGPDQFLAGVSDVLFQTNPQTQAGVWVPFPGCCCPQDQIEPPEDVNPITLNGLTLLPDGKSIELSVGAGTPGLAYLASFIATAGPYARRKEVGVVMTCFALRPFTGVVLPPPPPTIDISGGITLPVGSQGSVNIHTNGTTTIVITLPLTPVLDQSLRFKDVTGHASGQPVTIRTADSSLIDGQATRFLFQDFEAVELYWQGAGWGVR